MAPDTEECYVAEESLPLDQIRDAQLGSESPLVDQADLVGKAGSESARLGDQLAEVGVGHQAVDRLEVGHLHQRHLGRLPPLGWGVADDEIDGSPELLLLGRRAYQPAQPPGAPVQRLADALADSRPQPHLQLTGPLAGDTEAIAEDCERHRSARVGSLERDLLGAQVQNAEHIGEFPADPYLGAQLVGGPE